MSVETFIKQLQKLQAEAQQAQTKQRPKMLRSGKPAAIKLFDNPNPLTWNDFHKFTF